jgi:uncharacterized protein (TIGR00255 family)
MTGQGDGFHEADGVSVSVDVRTINSRYFKLNLRTSDGFGGLEANVESRVRKLVRRGTINVDIRIDRPATNEDYQINEQVLQGYQAQLQRLAGQAPPLGELLPLPGVVSERLAGSVDVDAIWPVVEPALRQALEKLHAMRTEEGKAMSADLCENCRLITTELEQVEVRAPNVVDNYRSRLTDRLTKLLKEYDVSVEAADVIREVGMFADRCDISEETVRLRSHLEQFGVVLDQDNNGKKLDFLTQEMFRETNTIGSKANDAEIAKHVVEIKTAIERMREMIQNVE